MKYRKKPVEIDAELYSKNGKHPLDGVCYLQHSDIYSEPHVHTLESTSYGLQEGDWVIKGVKGEYYPCKPDIFELTYEPVS